MPAAETAKGVLVAGEINVDLICQGYHAFPAPGREVLVDDFKMVLGSASAICAMGLARLGTPVTFFGKVGDDPTGHFCLDAMRARGIDLSLVVADPDVTTGVTVAITSPADRALVSYPRLDRRSPRRGRPAGALPVGPAPPRLVLLPAGGAAARGRGAVPRGATRRASRTSLDPASTRARLGTGPRRDARARRRLLPQRGRARGAHAIETRRGVRALQTRLDRVIAKARRARGAMAIGDGGRGLRVPRRSASP
jgi:hypothetical protein